MNESPTKKIRLKEFPKMFWVSILFEFFERGSYYGVMSVLSIYLVLDVAHGGLGFSKQSVGLIKSTLQPLLYFLPILSGVIGDQIGYRKTFIAAFTLLSLGYFLTGQMTSYGLVFASLMLMGVGAGTFKPIVSGTIARVTNERTSGLGFGIFYWSINLGAFLFPLILVPILKQLSWSYVFYMAAIGTGLMLIPTLFIYKEPPKPQAAKTLAQLFSSIKTGIVRVFSWKLALVFVAYTVAYFLLFTSVIYYILVIVVVVLLKKDFRFFLMILIYSGFWVLYFQQFDTVLWYLKDYVDMTVVDQTVNGFLGWFGIQSAWKFDAEHVTVINAGTIIVLQIFISKLVSRRKALPTMITGMALGTIGISVLAISTHPWVFIAGLVIFSIGEMTAHPKYISYIGLVAPRDKVATYLGYSFLYGVFGSGIGGVLGASLYVHFVDTLKQPSTMWLIFAAIGLTTIIGLLLYQKFLAPKAAHEQA